MKRYENYISFSDAYTRFFKNIIEDLIKNIKYNCIMMNLNRKNEDYLC